MKRNHLITTFFIVALVGGYFFWEFNRKQTVIKPWDLVPEGALIAYQHEKNSVRDNTDWLIKSKFPDSISKNLLRENEIVLSIHVLGKDELGVVVYLVDVPPGKFSETLKTNPTYQERVFEGFKIDEVSIAGNRNVSTTTIDRIRVISSNSILIEDVIRLARSDNRKNFIAQNEKLFRLARTKSDSGNVYINLTNLSVFFNLFRATKNQNSALDRFALAGVVERKSQGQNLLLSGFAVDSLTKGTATLSLFNHQRPVSITLPQIVSNRTGILTHFGMSDFTTWNKDRLKYAKENSLNLIDSLNELNGTKGFDANRFYQTLGDEVGICSEGIFSGEVFILSLKNPALAMAELLKLNGKRNLPVENFAHYQIRLCPVESVTFSLFWPLTSRRMNYYVVTDHHVIFSENQEDLKSFISDMDGENTWGKSSEWNEFLSTTQDTNAGVIFDAINWWPTLRPQLTPKWQAFGDSTHFMNLNKGSLQFSRLDEQYYFNGAVKFETKRSRKSLEQKGRVLEIVLPQPIRSPLTAVRNHSNGNDELLIQDQTNDLYLISSNLKSLFRTKVDGTIKSAVHQIDFYKNKKLQYLFATENSLCLIDRLGNTVKGFPKSIPGQKPIQFLSVIDYDHSGNYSFLVSDSEGTLIQYNRNGNVLSNWNKVELKKELWVAPRSVRSLGKDRIIAITVDGTVFVYNKDGRLLDGFPVSLKLRPAGSWIFEKAEGQDVITVVSDDGVKAQINLNGKVVSRNSLIKSSAASKFSLVPSSEGHFVISRIDKRMVAILTAAGEVLFERENPGSEEIQLAFFEVGRGTRLFSITDPHQEFSYFFDEKGRSIFPQPLESERGPMVLGKKLDEITFYCLSKNTIRSYRPGR